MKIDVNVNPMAATPRPRKEEPAGDDFERMLEDASKGAAPTSSLDAAPAADAPQDDPQPQTVEDADAQKAASDETDAQELPEESGADDERESAETPPVEENVDLPVVIVAAAPAVASDAVDGADEVAQTGVQTNAGKAPGSGDPAFLSAVTAAVEPAPEADAQVVSQTQTSGAPKEAKPQAAHANTAAESVEADAEVVLSQAGYKPAVSAKPLVAEAGAEAKADVSAAAAQQAERPVVSAADTSQQPQQEQESARREEAAAQVSWSAKPQAAEAAEPTQPAIAQSAPAGVQVEAAALKNIEAAPPASATQATEAPRPASASSTTAAHQPLHAQQQERDEQRVAEQALRAVRSVVNQRGGSLTLRLNPPELGDLRIRLEMTQQVVSARLETSTDAVRQLLQQQLPQLHSALSSHGLTVDQIQVQTQSPAPDGQRGAQDNNSGGDGAEGRSRGGFERQQQRGEDRRQQHDELSRFQRELLDLVA